MFTAASPALAHGKGPNLFSNPDHGSPPARGQALRLQKGQAPPTLRAASPPDQSRRQMRFVIQNREQAWRSGGREERRCLAELFPTQGGRPASIPSREISA